MKSKTGRIRITFFSILLISFNSAVGQCYYAQADRFDNVWVINQSEVIFFNKELKKIGTYSNILLGNPYSIDALDPFRILVFYPNSQAVTILNNAVAEIAKPILLREKGISDACLVCSSRKGGYWVLDRASWEILHFDSGFNSTGEKIIPDITFSGSTPIFMQEYKGILYLAFKDIGICRFDAFGARLGDIPVRINSYFTFIDDEIVYQINGKTFHYNHETSQVKVFDPPVNCIPIKVQGQFLYFDGSGLAVYKI